MRVALVVNSYPAISETFIVNKARALRHAGVDVTVVSHSYRSDAEYFRGARGDGTAERIRYALAARGPAATPVRAATMLVRHPGATRTLLGAARARYGTGRRSVRAWALGLPLVADGFDIVHFEYSGIAVSYLDVLPLLLPAKLFVSCRGAAEQITPLVDPGRAEELREVFGVVDRVHCVSNDMLETVRQYGLDPRRAFVNYPSIDLGEFRRLRPYRTTAEGSVRIVSTGRLHWKKGFEYALLAVRKLLDGGHDVSYAILGGGPEEERLRVTINDLRLTGHVELRGRQRSEAVRAALEEADIYLLPSVSEGLSNAALEAMAMELPLVSTSAGGMAEAIDDGEEGLLVPTRDVDALARRIEELLPDPVRRLEMGRAGRRRVERQFSLERQTARFVEEYERYRPSPL